MFELYNEDCLDVLRRIQSNSINCIITDPPYMISRDTGFKNGSLKKFTVVDYNFGEWDKKELDLKQLFKEYYRVLMDGGSVIFFYDIWKLETLKRVAEEVGFKKLRVCFWEKDNPVPINSSINYLTNARECFITMCKGSNPTFNSKYDNGIYRCPICHGDERTEHPTQKPLSLMIDIVMKHTNEKDIVLDTFMGSGSTGVACNPANRNFIGIELEEKYFNIAKIRIEDSKRKLW